MPTNNYSSTAAEIRAQEKLARAQAAAPVAGLGLVEERRRLRDLLGEVDITLTEVEDAREGGAETLPADLRNVVTGQLLEVIDGLDGYPAAIDQLRRTVRPGQAVADAVESLYAVQETLLDILQPERQRFRDIDADIDAEDEIEV